MSSINRFVLLGKLYAIAVNVKSEEIYEGFCAIDIFKLFLERNRGRSNTETSKILAINSFYANN